MIEQMESLTKALKSHTEAMNNLASALTANGQLAITSSSEAPVVEYDEPIYWIDNKTGEHGQCANSAEWVAVKTKSATVIKAPESKYKKFVEDQEDKKAEEEKPAAKEKTSRKPKPKSEKEPDPETTDDTPEVDIPEVTEAELIDAFKGFMSPDLDKAERDERIAFVKPMLQRFGVNKATELAEADRGIAVRLLQLKEEGFDIDPNVSGWDPISVIAECEAEGSTEDGDDNLV